MDRVPSAFAKAVIAQLRNEPNGVRYSHLLRWLRAESRAVERLALADEYMQVLFDAFSPRLRYNAETRLVTLLPPPRMGSYSKAILDGIRNAYENLNVRVYRPGLTGDGCMNICARDKSWKLQVATNSEYRDTEVHIIVDAPTQLGVERISIHHEHRATLEAVRDVVDDILSERLVVWWIDWEGYWGGSEMRLPNQEPSPELTRIGESNPASRIRAWSWNGTYAQ